MDALPEEIIDIIMDDECSLLMGMVSKRWYNRLPPYGDTLSLANIIRKNSLLSAFRACNGKMLLEHLHNRGMPLVDRYLDTVYLRNFMSDDLPYTIFTMRSIHGYRGDDYIHKGKVFLKYSYPREYEFYEKVLFSEKREYVLGDRIGERIGGLICSAIEQKLPGHVEVFNKVYNNPYKIIYPEWQVYLYASLADIPNYGLDYIVHERDVYLAFMYTYKQIDLNWILEKHEYKVLDYICDASNIHDIARYIKANPHALTSVVSLDLIKHLLSIGGVISSEMKEKVRDKALEFSRQDILDILDIS